MHKHAFIAVSNYSSNFDDPDEPLDGIVGLSFIQSSQTQTLPLLDVMLEQKLIDSKQFSFQLSSKTDSADPSVNSQSSKLLIGSHSDAYLKSRHAPDGMVWLNTIASTGMWIIDLSALSHSSDYIESPSVQRHAVYCTH